MRKIIPLLMCILITSCNSNTSSSKQEIQYEKTAHVILLSGQSNAVGYSRSLYILNKQGEAVFNSYNSGPKNVLINYYIFENGIGSRENVYTRVQFGDGAGGDCFGPEVGMASVLASKPEETYYILKYAAGGTSLVDDWINPSRGEPSYLYKSFVEFVNNRLSYLQNKYPKTKFVVDSLCWMQGENDASGYNASQAYQDNLVSFMGDLQNEFKDYNDKKMTIIDAGISQVWAYYKTINDAKKNAENLIENYHYFSTIDLGLVTDTEPEGNPDIAHYDASSMIELGEKFGSEILKYID